MKANNKKNISEGWNSGLKFVAKSESFYFIYDNPGGSTTI